MLRRLPDCAATLPACSENAEPKPDNTAMYCSPLTSYDTGAAMIGDWTESDQSFSPVSARYAFRLPAASPWMTRFPAVVTMPPFHGPM